MKFWQVVAFTEPDQLIEVARIAEEVGFDGLLLADHLFFPEKLDSRYPYAADGRPAFDAASPFPDPWCSIAALAAATTRLRFGTMVYILPLRNPIEVAKAVSTAAVLSGDRVALGTGAGWIKEEYDVLGVDFHTRGRRYDEAIQVLRKLWGGGMVEHHGRFFDFDRLAMCPAPKATIPIWIGGASPPALRRAARLGDGWIGTGQTPEEAAEILGSLASMRHEAGRAAEPFEAIVPLTTPPDRDVLLRLEDAGAAGTTAWPFVYTVGPGSSLAQKRAALESYAENVIVPDARPLTRGPAEE